MSSYKFGQKFWNTSDRELLTMFERVARSIEVAYIHHLDSGDLVNELNELKNEIWERLQARFTFGSP